METDIPFMYVYTNVELDVVICDFKFNVLYNPHFSIICVLYRTLSDIFRYNDGNFPHYSCNLHNKPVKYIVQKT